LQSFFERRRPGPFDVLSEAASHEHDRIAILAQGALRADAEPLRPGDLDECRGKAAASHLLVAFDRQAGASIAARMHACEGKIVGEPPRVAGLPIDARDPAEVGPETVRTGKQIEKETRGHGVLIAKATSASECNGCFALHAPSLL
jgi:hypothetical protein